ncbi:UspA domain protein [Halorhabdus utahensis DSM 12940]|uniref:UspA domain protein n=1 Tax=Halorhabdus utahensis (strain DSM 12940 / JCM 11049 / AX-2) TaxID=519442 RepID=C7NMG8_HALUD|nr:universal stress protein [Halorhabdus utahensis]ACV12607.1 UspA domain protein [Halorhabdus utahensis DSM 12940]
MEQALVVVDDTEASEELLRKAGDIAEGLGAKLYLFGTLDPDEFDEARETLDTIGEVENTSYTDSDILKTVHTSLNETIEEVFGDPDFAYETVGAVAGEGDRASKVIEAAEKFECGHIFLSGRKRSPTGKALFGDTVQSVLLDFDGEVTVNLQ